MVTVEINGWRSGFAKVGHTKALQEFAGLSLSEAKQITDSVLEGKAVSIALPDITQATLLANRLSELGASAQVNAGSSHAI